MRIRTKYRYFGAKERLDDLGEVVAPEGAQSFFKWNCLLRHLVTRLNDIHAFIICRLWKRAQMRLWISRSACYFCNQGFCLDKWSRKSRGTPPCSV